MFNEWHIQFFKMMTVEPFWGVGTVLSQPGGRRSVPACNATELSNEITITAYCTADKQATKNETG
jgi:hypothetical protein